MCGPGQEGEIPGQPSGIWTPALRDTPRPPSPLGAGLSRPSFCEGGGKSQSPGWTTCRWCREPGDEWKEGMEGPGWGSGGGPRAGLSQAWLALHVVCSFSWVRAHPGLWRHLKLSLCLMQRRMGL